LPGLLFAACVFIVARTAFYGEKRRFVLFRVGRLSRYPAARCVNGPDMGEGVPERWFIKAKQKSEIITARRLWDRIVEQLNNFTRRMPNDISTASIIG